MALCVRERMTKAHCYVTMPMQFTRLDLNQSVRQATSPLKTDIKKLRRERDWLRAQLASMSVELEQVRALRIELEQERASHATMRRQVVLDVLRAAHPDKGEKSQHEITQILIGMLDND